MNPGKPPTFHYPCKAMFTHCTDANNPVEVSRHASTIQTIARCTAAPFGPIGVFHAKNRTLSPIAQLCI